jgi:hypothetical protein
MSMSFKKNPRWKRTLGRPQLDRGLESYADVPQVWQAEQEPLRPRAGVPAATSSAIDRIRGKGPSARRSG